MDFSLDKECTFLVKQVVCGEDNKYATLIFIINNARIGYI